MPFCASCCFGGPDLETLFASSASIGLDEAARGAALLSGGVLAVRGVGVRGRLAAVFRG